MKKTLSEAKTIESEIYTKMVIAKELIDHIYSYGDGSQLKELWEIRARLQDALRAMNDLNSIRKGLPYVND